MTAKRRRNLIQAVAIVLGVVILNLVFPQPWHVTLTNIVIAVALGAGLGVASSVTDDVIKWRRKAKP